MNRNKEWEDFVNEMFSGLPKQLEDSAQRAVARVKNKHLSVLIKIPVAVLLALFVAFIALARMSSGFAKVVRRVPFLRVFTKGVPLT